MAGYYDKRWAAPVSDNQHQLHARVPATPAGVVKARHLVTGWSERHGADADLQGDIALAVTEATTNAVLHGYPLDSHGVFFLAAETDGAELVVVVRDYGVGIRAKPPSQSLGVGLTVINRLAAACQIEEVRPGTLVRMRFRRSGRAPQRP